MNPVPDVFAALCRDLPRIAEEGGDREEIPESELSRRLIASTGAGIDQAEAVLGVVRQMLRALSVLDESQLAAGRWAFVSFPASLLARSILAGLASPEYQLLEPGYWNSSDYLIDRQRALIKDAEELRAALPAGLVPIRRVWVSWAWLTLDGRFLLVRREDPSPLRDGSRGEFVFPGGRVAPEDLHDSTWSTASGRLDFFDPHRAIDPSQAQQVFARAVRRELREELEIPSNGLTAVTAVGEVIRYHALEGAKSTFSATEYFIQPFRADLSNTGKTALLRCLAKHPDRFAWFSAEELAAGTNARGAKAFVDAVRQNYPKLEPDAYAIRLESAPTIEEAIDIPGSPAESFAVGISGRERYIHVDLDANEIELLNWLAAVRRGDLVADFESGVASTGASGWVLVANDQILSELRVLASKLKAKSLPLLDLYEHAVRLNASTPYYSPSLLSMEIQDERRGKAYRLTLSRRRIQTKLGTVAAYEEATLLPEILGNAIYALSHGDPESALENIDTVKRMQRDIRGFLDAIGVRLLIRQVDSVPELVFNRK